MIKYFLSRQFFLFFLVGLSAVFFNWMSRIFLSQWLDFSTAVFVAYFVGMFVAFILNRNLVFPNTIKSLNSQILSFIATNLFFFPFVWFASIKINELLIYNNFLQYNEEISHAIALSFPMMATFLIYKIIAFKE